MGKPFKIILLVSIALNLLMTGMWIGSFSRGCRRPPPFHPPPQLGQISPEGRRLFDQAMEGLRDKNRETAEEIQKTRKKILEILSAPQFDPKAYQEASAQLHDLHGKMKGQMTQTVVGLAGQLSEADRKVLASILEAPPPPPPGGGHHHPPPPGFPGPPPGGPPLPNL